MIGLVFLALALLGGGWWFSRPKPLRLAALLPHEGLLFGPVSSGFLTSDHPYRYRFREWDGRERWRVQAPSFHFSGRNPQEEAMRSVFWHPGAWALSADGRRFALAVPSGPQLRLMVWQDGRREADAAIPMTGAVYDAANAYRVALALAADGTVLCAIPTDTSCRLYAARGDRLIARGTYAYAFKPIRRNSHRVALLPDLGLLAATNEHDFDVADLTVAGGAIRCTHRCTRATGMNRHLANGYALGNDLRWYRLADGSSRPAGARGDWFSSEYHATQLLERTHPRWSLLALATGRRQYLPDRMSYEAVSADGRYLVGRTQPEAPARLVAVTRWAARRLPALAPALQRLERPNQTLLVLTPAGRRLAGVSLTPASTKSWSLSRLTRPNDGSWHRRDGVATAASITLDFGSYWVIAPDGRSVVTMIAEPPEGLAILRW